MPRTPSRPARSVPSHSRRQPRADGTATRASILEAAGRIYAAKGFERTTSKEICERAGVNIAAVNYHFGSKAGLYAEVLVEAHRQLIVLDEMEAIASNTRAGAEKKLLMIFGGIASRVSASALPWGLRVLVREMTTPSVHARALIERAIAPKAALLRRLIAEILGLTSDHPSVQHCLAFLIGQVMILLIAPKELRRTVLPALNGNSEGLVADLSAYMVAGLRGIRLRHAKDS